MTSHASGTVLHLALPLADRADVTSPATATTWW